MKKSRSLKIGVIGLGVMGRHHSRISSIWLKGACLAAVADINQQAGQLISRLYQAEYYQNYHELLPLVQAVVVATPTETHREVAAACLSAGLPTLVEKPLAKTADDAACLAALAQEKDVILAVGLIERFNPAFVELVKLVGKEKIIGIDIKRLSPFPARITDVNVIYDVMIHDLDLVSALLPNEELEDIKAKGERIQTQMLDHVTAILFYKSGIIAKIEANRVFGGKTRKIVVTTEKAIYEADLLNQQVYVRTLENHVPSTHHTKNYDQLTAELKDFVQAIKTARQPKVNAAAGVRCLRLAEEVEKACS